MPVAQAPPSGDNGASADLNFGGGKVSLSIPQIQAMLNAILGGKVRIGGAGAGNANGQGGLQVGTSGTTQAGGPPNSKRDENPLSGLMGGGSGRSSPFDALGSVEGDDESPLSGFGRGYGGGDNSVSDLTDDLTGGRCGDDNNRNPLADLTNGGDKGDWLSALGGGGQDN